MYELAAYKASRLAVKYSPPTLFLEYIDAQRHVRVRAVKLSNISQATDPEYLTCKVIKGFPRGLDLRTVNTQQVTQLLQQLIDHSYRGLTLKRGSSGRRRSSSSGNGQAATCSTAQDPEAAAATCVAARALNCSRSTHDHHHQQQQQPAASTASEQQQPAEQHACTASCSGPGTSCRQQQQQFSRTPSLNLKQQQQQHAGLAGADSAAKHSMDSRLDGRAVSSVTMTLTASQQQQQQQHDASCSSVNACLNHSQQQHKSSTQAASGASVGVPTPPRADAQPAPAAPAPAADAGSAHAPHSSSSSAAVRGGSSGEDDDEDEDDDGGCLVLEPDFVTADGCEVDLNKVSDYELRLAKAQMHAAFQQNQLKPGDAGYVYDKQADFAPVQGGNDWDDEE